MQMLEEQCSGLELRETYEYFLLSMKIAEKERNLKYNNIFFLQGLSCDELSTFSYLKNENWCCSEE